MFGAMRPKNASIESEFKRLFEASFDDELRRSVREYLKREGMSRSRFGRIVLRDPGFVGARLNGGGSVTLKTADEIREWIGEMPFRALFCLEVEAFLLVAGLKPWAVGYQSVRQSSFLQRLREGSSPYLSTVDRVRGWMRAQASPSQRREILVAVTGALAATVGAAPQSGVRMNARPVLYTTEQAAAWLGLSARTLEKYRMEGKGPRFCKIGRWVRYLESDLEDWLVERMRHSTSDDGSAPKEAAQ